MKNSRTRAWLLCFALPLVLLVLAQSSRAQDGLPALEKDGSCTAEAAAKRDGINWEPDLKTAMAKAKKLDRPVFIAFLCRFLGDCNSPHA